MMKNPSVAPEGVEPAVANGPARRESWVPLENPFRFMGKQFCVELRLVDGSPPALVTEQDIRVPAPLCEKCGRTMYRRFAVPHYDNFVCPRDPGHPEFWLARSTDGATLLDRAARWAALTQIHGLDFGGRRPSEPAGSARPGAAAPAPMPTPTATPAQTPGRPDLQG